jgi:lysine-N-methylase
MLTLMSAPSTIVQPRHYETFRCLGADCEDTCCDGWTVNIDRGTYDKYQRSAELRTVLNNLVLIEPEKASYEEYASIKMVETHCPYLSEGLCSIHNKHGEGSLANVCAIYPRIMNQVGDVLERNLDLSCPEAARVVLLDPDPIDLLDTADQIGSFRMGAPRVPGIPNASYDDREYPHFLAVRDLIITILRARAYPLWKRLVIIGHLCDKLSEMAAVKNDQYIPLLIRGYLDAVSGGQFDEILSKCKVQPSAQVVTVLELVVSRISSDFTGRRFLDCYQDFMHGLQWAPESLLPEVTRRYTDAWVRYYVPFFDQNQSLMERYFEAYVYRNLMPLGRLEVNRKSGLHGANNSISVQCMLMMAYYAIIRTILIGMASHHQSAFGMDHVIKVIQSSTKAFQHSISFPAKAIEILTRNSLKTGASMAVLVQDLNSL